jgi:RNA polymerase sigma-70 factor, ECF subfamily
MAVPLEELGRGEERSENDSFTHLYETGYRPLVGYCSRLLAGTGDPEAVAQEAFTRAWLSWERYSSQPFWPLVARIARNLCMDHHRRRQFAAAVLERRKGELSRPQVPMPEEAFEASEERRWARLALDALHARHRRVIELRDLQGLSYEAIAESEGTTVESVRGSLRRARLHLREAYARIAESGPAAVVLDHLRRLWYRLGRSAHRLSEAAAASPILAARAGDVLAALVAIALVTSASPPVGHAGGTGIWRPKAIAEASDRADSHAVASNSTATERFAAERSAAADVRHPPSSETATRGSVPSLPAFALGGGGETPEQAAFEQFVASPHAEQDHEFYAVGASWENCAGSYCHVIFRSRDAGASWTKLPAIGFVGGTLMLPPSYPADSRIFVAGPTALQVSNDGGATFKNLTPLGGFGAISPAFSAGDPRILLGAIPGWVYHDDSKVVTPLDMTPAPVGWAQRFAFSPSYPADPRVAIGGTNRDGDPQRSAVAMCRRANCGPAVSLPGLLGAPNLLLTRRFSTTGIMFAWAANMLYRSTDGGSSFAALSLPMDASVEALSEDGSGSLYAALDFVTGTSDGTIGGIFVSHDRGSTWARLGEGTALAKGTSTVAAMPDGHLFASPDAFRGGGVFCSTDAGQTWARRCANP